MEGQLNNKHVSFDPFGQFSIFISQKRRLHAEQRMFKGPTTIASTPISGETVLIRTEQTEDRLLCLARVRATEVSHVAN